MFSVISWTGVSVFLTAAITITMLAIFGYRSYRKRLPRLFAAPASNATSTNAVITNAPLTFEMLATWQSSDRRAFTARSTREILNIPFAVSVSGFQATLPNAYVPSNVMFATVIGDHVLALSIDKMHLVHFERNLHGRYLLKYVSCGSRESLEDAYYIFRAQLHDEYLARRDISTRRIH
jgi:hypothetical protein